jgi:hypothetical protein
LEQYSTLAVDPSGGKLCASVPAGKIVMSQLEKVAERVETFEHMPERNEIKKAQ